MEITKKIVDYLNSLSLDVKMEIIEVAYVEEDKLIVKMLIDNLDYKKAIFDSLVKFLKIDLEVPKVKIEIEKKLVNDFSETKVIIVASGKGGVGKSSVSANLANALNKRSYKVGLIDADIYGSSIPLLFNLVVTPEVEDNLIKPLCFENIEMIGSLALNPNDESIVWRGPMLGRLLNTFFNEVKWSSDLDYLIIDLPPGTGDIPLDIKNLVPHAATLIVTTPSKNASKVAIKAGQMAITQAHEIIGVIENMSYYNHHGEKLHIFGTEGANIVADALNTEVLIRLPLVNNSDGSIYDLNTEIGHSYLSLVNNIENYYK